MVNPEKYARTVILNCPTCGGTQFEYDDEADNPPMKCAECGRETSKDALIGDNEQNLDAHKREIGKAAAEDLAKEMGDRLKKAFSGNKYIKIK